MASIFKPPGKSKYVIFYTDENGRRKKKTGSTDKPSRSGSPGTSRIAWLCAVKGWSTRERKPTRSMRLIPSTFTSPPGWSRCDQGATPQHVKLHSSRAMRVVALIKGAKLADIEPGKPATKEGWHGPSRIAEVGGIGPALRSDHREGPERPGADQGEGRSLQTCNHHRNAIKSFAKWLYETHRIRENILRGVAGFNVKEDPRHERRTVSLDELRRLIEAAEAGEPFKSMTGPMRRSAIAWRSPRGCATRRSAASCPSRSTGPPAPRP